MTVLMYSGRRVCNSRCHNAKKPACKCVCESRYHGLGTEKATERRDDDALKILDMMSEEVECQTN